MRVAVAVAVAVGAVPVAACVAAGARVAVAVGAVPVAVCGAAGARVAVLVPDGGTVAVPLNKPDVAGAGPVAPPLPVGRAVDVLLAGDGTVVDPWEDAPTDEVTVGDEMPADGEKIDGTDEEDPPVQAEIDAETRTVTVAQPAAVSLALLTFMRPPAYPADSGSKIPATEKYKPISDSTRHTAPACSPLLGTSVLANRAMARFAFRH